MFRSIVVDDFMTTHLATAKPDMDLLSLVDLLLIQVYPAPQLLMRMANWWV